MKRLTLLLALIASSFGTVLAQEAQNVYDDALHQGWQNYSWASTSLANTSPTHGGSKSISVTAGGYQAAYFANGGLNSSLLGTLSFWINGGSSGGQHLQVVAVINGVGQTPVAITPLQANAWNQVSLSMSTLGVAPGSNLTGFWIQNSSGGSIPKFYLDDLSISAVAPPSTVSLGINLSNLGAGLDSKMFGVNAAVWDSSFGDPATVSMLNEMGIKTMRFPAGSGSDEYHWSTNKSLSNTWAWATSFDTFANQAVAANAQMIITTNYGTSNAADAAAWVQYANGTRHLALRWWEVGNENYGGWETDTHPRPHDPYTYGQQFAQYQSQMLAADPTVNVGAVVTVLEDDFQNYSDHPALNPRTGATHTGWTPVLLSTLAAQGVTPQFVVFHRYAQNGGQENDESLLLSNSTWASDVARLRQMLIDYLGAASAAKVTILCTENNSVSATPGKQTVSLVNALYMADSCASAMTTEARGYYWWDLRNGAGTGGNNDPSLYGWRNYGDYGIVDGTTTKYPTYYSMKMLSLFAGAGCRLGVTTSSYPLVSAYALKAPDSSYRLMVINKSRTNTFSVTGPLLGVPNTISKVETWSYGMPQDNAAQTGNGSQDVQYSYQVRATRNLALTVAPYSITVIKTSVVAPLAAPDDHALSR